MCNLPPSAVRWGVAAVLLAFGVLLDTFIVRSVLVPAQVLDLGGSLLRGDVGVRVVLGHRAHAGEAVDDAGLLVAVDRAELEEPQRQLAVGPPARPEDQVVHRAVHRLEVVVLPRLDDLALGVDGLVHVHGRVHPVGVPLQVP